MSKNFVSYDDIETIIEKIKLELDKKAVVVAITQEDYDALSEEEKNNGTIYFIIDYNEISGGGIATKLVIKGYYNSEDGKFYNEPSFSTETAISANYLYIDLAENIIYIYDSTTEEFIALGGGQSDGITKISMNGDELTVTDGEVDLGTVLTEHQDISGKQDKSTAVKYNGSSAVGSATKGVYVDASGNATAMTYELNKSVPADAKFTDTTYSKATTSDDGLMSKEDKAKLDGLSDVASSGSYNDLEDQPTIPTVNNGTLTIQKNGTNVQTFTANQSENVTANITVPTKVSELTNDSGFTSNTGTVTSVKVGTTSYNPSNGVVSLPAYPVNTNTTYTITQDATDGHKFTFAGSDGSSKTITIPDNNTTYTLSSLGIGNVKDLDQSKAIKNITRNGTTFTYTCLDGTTGTFTQQDNNTWTAMVGATASADGTAGYVPAPPSDGYNTKFLRADGNWETPDGLMTDYDREKLNNVSLNFAQQIFLNMAEIDIIGRPAVGDHQTGITINAESPNYYADVNVVGAYVDIIVDGEVRDTRLTMFHIGENKAIFVHGTTWYYNSDYHSRLGEYEISFMDLNATTDTIRMNITFSALRTENQQDLVIKVPFDRDWGCKIYLIYDNSY